MHRWQSGAQEAERADLKQLSPRQTVAEVLRSAQDAQHLFPFRNSDVDRRQLRQKSLP
jgi:hypothetical protein